MYFGALKKSMRSNLVLIFTFLLHAAGIAQDNPLKIRLDPSDAMGASVSQVFAEVRFTPLETTKTSSFGQISELVITEEFFIILDDQTNAILIFRKDGKFHAKISGGSNPSDRIMLFHVNRFAKEIQFVKSGNGQPKKYYFGFDAIKKKEEALAMEANSFLQYAELPGAGIIGQRYTAGEDYPDSTAYELTLLKTAKATAGYLPYNTKKSPLAKGDIRPYSSSPFFRTTNDTILYFSRYWDYSVYRITPHTFQKELDFIFPRDYSLPAGFMTDSSLLGKRQEYAQSNKQAIYLIPSFLNLPGNYLLKLKNNQSPVDASTVLDYTLFLYNIRSGTLIDLFKVLPDQSSSFLPIVDNLGNVSMNAKAYSDGQHLYTSVSSLSMFLSQERNGDKKVRYEKTMENYFRTRNRKDNPVIVQLRPKS